MLCRLLEVLYARYLWERIWDAASDKTDKKTIKELKEKNYVCLPSDKDTEFCVIQQDTYTRVALDYLNDANTYQKVSRMSAKTVENKVNTAWKKICRQNEFPPFVQKSFLASNTDLPKFYHLRSISGPDIKIRPIVSNFNGPTQRISWLFANALKPMLKHVLAHLENSLELIRCIQAGDLTTNKALSYPCSLDVVSLYTTIPIQEAITNATDRIQNSVLHLSKQDVSDLLQVTLNNMYFSFRDQVFRQKEGLPMDSSISSILAILFMDKLESIALSSHLMINPYKRYVDDIYLQTTNEETADHFHKIINNVHPNLKFEIEKPQTTPNGQSLSLLDFKVTFHRMATALLNSTKSQPRNHYLSTISQPCQPNPNSTSFATRENALKADAPQIHLQNNTWAHSMTSFPLTVTQRNIHQIPFLQILQ